MSDEHSSNTGNVEGPSRVTTVEGNKTDATEKEKEKVTEERAKEDQTEPTAEQPEKTKPAPKAVVKPAKAPPPPDPKAMAAKAEAERIAALLREAVGPDAVEEVGLSKYIPMLTIPPTQWTDVIRFMHDDPSLDLNYFECMAGTDYKEHIEIVLYMQSLTTQLFVGVKAKVARDGATLPSITSIFAGACWEEREIYDLLGVAFTGHPDLRRIMLDDDWVGHPLRKDYSPMD